MGDLRFFAKKLSLRFGLLVPLVLGLVACHSNVEIVREPSEPLNLKKIRVLPFENMSVRSGENLQTRCPVCGRVFISGDVAENADNLLTAHLLSLLRSRTNYEIVVSSQTQDAQELLFTQDNSRRPPRKVLLEAGQNNGADAVTVGYVYRFRERVGRKYSAQSPASVAFGLHLIRVADGRSVWSAHFEETQRSLGENLFQLGTFFRRGGRWLTAEELAVYGLEQMLAKFPKS